MSKIELTEKQARQLVKAAFGTFGLNGGSEVATYGAMLDKAIELGIVRPASDDPMQREWEDVKERVAALEAKVNAPPPVYADAFGPIKYPDPHAAAKPTTSEVLAKHAREFVAQKPRTEADRLAVVAFDVDEAHDPNDVWARQSPGVKQAYRNIALAVRKAVLAAQLEPSEEEVEAATKCWEDMDDCMFIRDGMPEILAAAARVRLAKAEEEDK